MPNAPSCLENCSLKFFNCMTSFWKWRMICTKVPILPLQSRHAHFMSRATGSGKYPLITLQEGSNKAGGSLEEGSNGPGLGRYCSKQKTLFIRPIHQSSDMPSSYLISADFTSDENQFRIVKFTLVKGLWCATAAIVDAAALKLFVRSLAFKMQDPSLHP